MRFRLAPNIASKVEGVRLKLNYSTLSETANLLLDAIRYQWDLKLSNLSSPDPTELRIRLEPRHIDWLSQYGTERGLNIPSATNLVISDYFRGSLSQFGTGDTQNKTFVPIVDEGEQKPIEVEPKLSETTQKLQKPTEVCPESGQPKPKGAQLLRGLKI